jgi:hypothetical protein
MMAMYYIIESQTDRNIKFFRAKMREAVRACSKLRALWAATIGELCCFFSNIAFFAGCSNGLQTIYWKYIFANKIAS